MFSCGHQANRLATRRQQCKGSTRPDIVHVLFHSLALCCLDMHRVYNSLRLLRELPHLDLDSTSAPITTQRQGTPQQVQRPQAE